MRLEPAHREAYVRLRKAQVAFPQILSAYYGVVRWASVNGSRSRSAARGLFRGFQVSRPRRRSLRRRVPGAVKQRRDHANGQDPQDDAEEIEIEALAERASSGSCASILTPTINSTGRQRMLHVVERVHAPPSANTATADRGSRTHCW